MFTKMIFMAELNIPDGVKVEVAGEKIVISGKLGKNERKFNANLLSVSIDGNKILIKPAEEKKIAKKARIAETSLLKELQNDIKGVQEYYTISMKAVFAHFPLTMEFKNGNVYINNLFGERVPRIARIVGDTKVEIKGQDLTLKGTSLDNVTQSAANIRKACRAKDKDIRIFQDGIYYAQ